MTSDATSMYTHLGWLEHGKCWCYIYKLRGLSDTDCLQNQVQCSVPLITWRKWLVIRL